MKSCVAELVFRGVGCKLRLGGIYGGGDGARVGVVDLVNVALVIDLENKAVIAFDIAFQLVVGIG